MGQYCDICESQTDTITLHGIVNKDCSNETKLYLDICKDCIDKHKI